MCYTVAIMGLPQRKFREIVFQIVYSRDFNENLTINSIGEGLKVTKRDMRLAHNRASLVIPYLPEIDRRIQEASTGYDLSRICAVERNVLRLAIFELLYDDAIPPKVALSEAIRLCRKYSTPESGSFVNGILDAVHSGTAQVS